MEPPGTTPLVIAWKDAAIHLLLAPLRDLGCALPPTGLAVTGAQPFDAPPPFHLGLAAAGGAAAALSPGVGREPCPVAAELHATCLATRSAVLLTPPPPGRELHLMALPGPVAFWCGLRF